LTRVAALAASEADLLFSCVDTTEGRHLADRIAAYFAMPLFDVGVAISTRKTANSLGNQSLLTSRAGPGCNARSVTQSTSNQCPAAFSEIREYFKLRAEIFSLLLR